MSNREQQNRMLATQCVSEIKLRYKTIKYFLKAAEDGSTSKEREAIYALQAPLVQLTRKVHGFALYTGEKTWNADLVNLASDLEDFNREWRTLMSHIPLILKIRMQRRLHETEEPGWKTAKVGWVIANENKEKGEVEIDLKGLAQEIDALYSTIG